MAVDIQAQGQANAIADYASPPAKPFVPEGLSTRF